MTAFGDFDAISVGDAASVVKTITEDDIRRFVALTGDDNPLHVDPIYAASTPLKDVVVHGMLGASFISTVIGTKLPGPGALWISQSLEFLLPLRLGDQITVTCTVSKKQVGQRLLDLSTEITNQDGQVILRGRGKVKVLKPRDDETVDRPDSPKVAIVTGGAGGIGRAICLRLARDGHRVVVNYRSNSAGAASLVEEIIAAEGDAVAVGADVATPDGVEALVAAAVSTFGGVSVVVNNASPRIVAKDLTQLEWTDIQHQLDVQVRAMFMLAKRCLPKMAAQRHGRIISIASQETSGTPTPNWTGYGLGKSGVTALSRYLAVEVGPMGITVNCVAPGMTQTRLIGDIPEKVQLITSRQTPMRRLAQPEDIAGAVAFLASDEAQHITGHTLHVNGGNLML